MSPYVLTHTLYPITTTASCPYSNLFPPPMDLAHLGFDNFFSSDSSSNATGFALENVGEISRQKCFGFGFLKQERAVNEDELMLRFPPQRSNGGGEGYQQMLSFSSPTHHTSRGAGYGSRGGMSMQQQQGVKGPFTPSQWMELEHQALIYKYITANVPIPSYLLNPITRAFESAGFPSLRSTALGWGGFQLGFGNSDPEPGRCRRTDGKKWRCSRDAVADQKYCERHINRGRHRSRKPVEPVPGPAPAPATTSSLRLHSNTPLSRISTVNRTVLDKESGDGGAYDHAPLVSPKDSPYKRHNAHQQEFGLVCSDSLLNPASSLLNSKTHHELRHFIDDGSKTQLSISIPTAMDLEMGLGLGSRAQPSWAPISMGGGGPLGEVVAGECKPLEFASSPTGVLQRVSLSNGSAASSPRAEIFLLNPSLPAL